LDFLAWEEARNLYLKYLEKKGGIANHKNPEYLAVQSQIIALKNASNAARTEHALPSNHKVTITKYWLLGFIEGEGCFSSHDFAIFFSLAQTEVNRHVLIAIRNYLLKFASNENAVTVVDKTPTKINQKPHSVLYVSGNPNCGTVLIPLLLDLHWFSVKRYSFIYVVTIYLLVVEGKHYTKIGADYIKSLYSIINK